MLSNSLRLFCFIFLYGLCSLKSYAQITFEKVIDTLGTTQALCIQETFDGGFIFCGGSSLNGNDIIVTKLNNTGSIEWTKLYSGPGAEGAVSVKQNPDSTFLVNAIFNASLNSQNWLLHLNSNGDTLWSKLYSAGPAATESRQMIRNNSGTCGIAGDYLDGSSTDAFFISTDDQGNLISSKIFTTPFSSNATGLTDVGLNGFAIAGSIGISSTSSDVYLMRINQLGDTLWTRHYDRSQSDVGNSIATTPNNGFIIGGSTWNNLVAQYNIYVVNTDSLGDTLWTKHYYNNFSTTTNYIISTNDGGFMILGRIVNGSPLNGNIILLKTDSAGNLQWNRQFGGSSSDLGNFIQQTQDGGYIICGNTSSFGNGGAYIIKTDSSGNVLTGTNDLALNNTSFSVFPNPGKDKIFIKSPTSMPEQFELEIYDIQGKLIYENFFYGELNSVNTEAFPSSVYYCKINYNNVVSVFKMVLVK